VVSKSIFLLVIPLSLSAFTHIWNPIGFPVIHIDEGYYMERAMDLLKGFGPLHYIKSLGYYDHPYFGQLFLAGALGITGYPVSLNSSDYIHSTQMAYFVPRVLMGILAVIDCFLIYKICECRYNRNVAYMASIMFAVMPVTWMLRSIWLDNILLPLLLSSILFATYTRDKADSKPVIKDMNKNLSKKIYSNNKMALVFLSGVFLGLAIFTKETAFTMVPLVGFLIFTNNTKRLKTLGIWFIPVILIPLIWPVSALSIGEFDKWLDVIQHQTHRESKPLVGSIIALFLIDPVLSILAITGILLAAIRKDLFLLLWVIPFGIFAYFINFVSLFHFILVIPVFCISAATLILDLSNKISAKMIKQGPASSFHKCVPPKWELGHFKINNFQIQNIFILRQNMISFIIVSTIVIFGLVSTAMLINLNLNSAYFKAAAFITKYLPDKDKTAGNASSIVTVLSRQSDYSWIPKYVFGKDQHDYQSYSWNKPIKTEKYLLVVDSGFRNIMSKSDEIGKKLKMIYNNSISKANFERESDYYNLYKYPYTSINDRQVLNSLGIASGTNPGRIEIRTNY